MPRIKMIHHVNVQISDRQRTREWYERVLGAEFLDRGPLNDRQLQLRIGTGEMHFSDTPNPTQVPSSHFAVEVDDWDETIANLDYLGVPYSRSPGGEVGPARTLEDTPYTGRREDNGEHYTYIRDPDGNVIELVYHPYGLEDGEGQQVELTENCVGRRRKQLGEIPAENELPPFSKFSAGLFSRAALADGWRGHRLPAALLTTLFLRFAFAFATV